MDEQIIKSHTLAFISKQHLAVVATVNESGLPEAALVGIGHTNDFEIIFGTTHSTRKYKNISRNPNVAMVIGWDKDQTVQLEGVASELDMNNPTDRNLVELYYWGKNPSARHYADNAERVYIKVSAYWVRYMVRSQYQQEFTITR